MFRGVISSTIPRKVCSVSQPICRSLHKSSKIKHICLTSRYFREFPPTRLTVVTPIANSPLTTSEMRRQMGDGQARVTRDTVIKQEREKFICMSREDKRHLYRCGSKFQTLDCIVTWPEYVRAHQDRLGELSCKDAKVEVDNKLNGKVSIWRGDITHLEIDAIVNAANRALLGGGGVDGAIHSAAGTQLYKECETIGGCDTGDAKITAGYKLPAKYIIHTVGPMGENSSKLRACYTNCLKRLEENNVRSIAFPCISTGIYGYPNGPACNIALETVRRWLEKDNNADKVDRIIFCLFMPVDVRHYENLMKIYFPLNKESLKAPPDELNLPEVPGLHALEDDVRGDGDGDSDTDEKPSSPASAARHRSPPKPSDSPEYKKKSASPSSPESKAEDVCEDGRDKSKPDGASDKEK